MDLCASLYDAVYIHIWPQTHSCVQGYNEIIYNKKVAINWFIGPSLLLWFISYIYIYVKLLSYSISEHSNMKKMFVTVTALMVSAKPFSCNKYSI